MSSRRTLTTYYELMQINDELSDHDTYIVPSRHLVEAQIRAPILDGRHGPPDYGGEAGGVSRGAVLPHGQCRTERSGPGELRAVRWRSRAAVRKADQGASAASGRPGDSTAAAPGGGGDA